MHASTLKHTIVLTLSAMLAGAEAVSGANPAAPGANTRRLQHLADQAGRLERGATGIHALRFERGREYRVVARCDGPCGDVTMQLFSPRGRELDRSQFPRRVGDVGIVPSRSGAYRVEVTMARCGSDACGYALEVLSR